MAYFLEFCFILYNHKIIEIFQNFDEKLLLLPKEECRSHIEDFLNTMQTVDHTGWVCGLGHGIHKTTPEENVKMFVRMVRERFK